MPLRKRSSFLSLPLLCTVASPEFGARGPIGGHILQCPIAGDVNDCVSLHVPGVPSPNLAMEDVVSSHASGPSG